MKQDATDATWPMMQAQLSPLQKQYVMDTGCSTHNGPAISPHLQYSTDESGCKTYVELSNAHDMPRPSMTSWHDTTVLEGAPEAGQIGHQSDHSLGTFSSPV